MIKRYKGFTLFAVFPANVLSNNVFVWLFIYLDFISLVNTSDYNKFTPKIFDRKIKEKRLVYRSDIIEVIDDSALDKKIAALAAKSAF